ncbi:deoxyguanosinetriphosphate triphosphohydrolase [Melioribacter roseus P3M-2]|uniref:Deoxyguanosinetriphosphate triphosphohydrolase-like protein n=1 Tax=Melioribacter roseus (strain DSM 23840 / JCM 17771 / VKM B-2668 / P3M-2) TaxID=1191523 RepID=I6Z5L0_MELRP|nr:dNTP triphosphohydrolase [Melioribacter roseus]AFN74440.1 deoxyguanosinetriphosphate triphosphohydrolase [Melioribacter roseus P3M-2]
MKNKFYNNFDIKRLKESERSNDYRTPFQIDRDRIIHSSEFRRLQGKTQVFLPGEYDFYRTRLTHSIEVAQIGRSICNYLCKSQKEFFNDEFHIDSDLVEAICLAHDLGHPPFGHAGERILNKLMLDYGGFEGNAQTLRLVTEIFYRDGNRYRGMNPTRAFLDGVLKYKALFSQFERPENHFLYDEQAIYIDFIWENGYESIKNDTELLNNFRSIECQIMDWADDTAYAVNDLVDSISGGFINIAKLSKWKQINCKTDEEEKIVEEIIDWIKEDNYKQKFGAQIGEFIAACSVKKRTTFMDDYTNRYGFELVVPEEIKKRVEIYKKISVDLVFRSPTLHQIEFKGNSMIEKVFKLLEENYIVEPGSSKLLPDFNDRIIRTESEKNRRARLVCDYIAGATDSYAMRIYRRLFDPDYSSLTDLV